MESKKPPALIFPLQKKTQNLFENCEVGCAVDAFVLELWVINFSALSFTAASRFIYLVTPIPKKYLCIAFTNTLACCVVCTAYITYSHYAREIVDSFSYSAWKYLDLYMGVLCNKNVIKVELYFPICIQCHPIPATIHPAFCAFAVSCIFTV